MDDVARMLEAAKLHLRKPINEVLPPSLLLYLVPPLPSLRLVITLFILSFGLLIRVWYILPSRKTRASPSSPAKTHKKRQGLTVAVFLGSGGHTTELLQLLSALPVTRYTRRIYFVSSGDQFSFDKAKHLELFLCSSSRTSSGSRSRSEKPNVKVIEIPRARKLHQSFITTPLSLLRSALFCIDRVAFRPLISRQMIADVVLMNGPGTCVPIVVAVYVLRILGLASPKLIYVESFARVKSFSLTAKLIRPFVDRFVLQWPRHPSLVDAATRQNAGSNTVFSGWLV
ncbi:related to ALG14 - component of UDP-GlcNAc transferase [Melanopsichium pennsylvanicum]|uniref:UDP-N-acetylglucosamine transferase subunit ALG14 n=2 Tax=Melanopsichium pennsylvanicum TaxID=63383 RepID=A0AAJ4XQC6_9BASI|nr:conserved hypothetical protein [Melanopsichium pennsylvanicum 4]SNX86482.1 related to ALG14 - component of UDP-GlcNAc transferase [Melanopsichium pennsylvanicum]